MKYQLRDYQQEASDAAVRFFQNGWRSAQNGLLVLPTGCHAKGSKILTWKGEKVCVEHIAVGDLLIGDDGNPRKVIRLHHGEDEMYRVTPIKGKPFVVNGGHILSLYRSGESKGKYCEISVERYLKTNRSFKHLHKLYKPDIVNFDNKQQLPIAPYMLGLLLGDGCLVNGSITITTMRSKVVSYLHDYCERNFLQLDVCIKDRGENKAKGYRLHGNGARGSNILLNSLRSLGVYGHGAGNKFIPNLYLTASKENRLQLLAGLLDTDAHYDKKRNSFEYCSKSPQLAEDIEMLARSLGFYARIGATKWVNELPYYRLQITGDLHLIPTKVEIRKGQPRRQKKNHRVTGFSIEHIGKSDYYGFEVDGNHLYLDDQLFVHHNSGKSLVIADIASKLDSDILVLQPSKEILEQNYSKLKSYGIDDCSIFSASCKSKVISRITFATIGSIMPHADEFDHFKYIIVDECHLVNATGGQYKDLFEKVKRKILGLTATPYRLSSNMQYLDCDGKAHFPPNDEKGMVEFYDSVNKGKFVATNQCILKFITRTRPRIFHNVLYQVDISVLLSRGYLAKMDYFDLSVINQSGLRRNSTGMDYDDESLKETYKATSLPDRLVNIVERLQKPKSGIPRKGILVFTKFIDEAEFLCSQIPGSAIVTGSTTKKERERILNDFKTGQIKVVANCGVLTTGFDYPELDTVVLARPTMSLALYYQIVGRAIRPHPDKQSSWIVDLCGNIQRFGRVEDFHLCEPRAGEYIITGNVNGGVKQLTNIYF